MKIEEGIVVNVYPERATVRVERQGNDDVVSAELKVIVPGTLKNQFYSMPQIGEHVMCMWPDTTKSDGYILGAIYSEVTEPPIKNEHKHYILFKDGSSIEHDTETGDMNVHVTGNLSITVDKNFTTTSNGSGN